MIGGCGLSTGYDAGMDFVPATSVPLDSGCTAFMNGSVVDFDTHMYALLLYADEGVDVVSLTTQVNNNAPLIPGVTSSAYSFRGSSTSTWLFTFAEIAVLVMLVVAPMAALSVGIARRRRRDDATLAALGAPPRTLRTAVVVEATMVAAWSIVVGMVWGSLSHLITTVNFARESLSGVIRDDYLHWMLSSIPLGPLLLIGAAGIAVFAASAAVAARALQRRTPVDNQRPVESQLLS